MFYIVLITKKNTFNYVYQYSSSCCELVLCVQSVSRSVLLLISPYCHEVTGLQQTGCWEVRLSSRLLHDAVSGSLSPPRLKWCKSVWASWRAWSLISTPAMRLMCDTDPGPRGRPSWQQHQVGSGLCRWVIMQQTSARISDSFTWLSRGRNHSNLLRSVWITLGIADSVGFGFRSVPLLWSGSLNLQITPWLVMESRFWSRTMGLHRWLPLQSLWRLAYAPVTGCVYFSIGKISWVSFICLPYWFCSALGQEQALWCSESRCESFIVFVCKLHL